MSIGSNTYQYFFFIRDHFRVINYLELRELLCFLRCFLWPDLVSWDPRESSDSQSECRLCRRWLWLWLRLRWPPRLWLSPELWLSTELLRLWSRFNNYNKREVDDQELGLKTKKTCNLKFTLYSLIAFTKLLVSGNIFSILAFPFRKLCGYLKQLANWNST